MADIFDQRAAMRSGNGAQPHGQLPPSMAPSGQGDIFTQRAALRANRPQQQAAQSTATPQPSRAGFTGINPGDVPRPTDVRSIPNPRIRNLPNPVDPSWGAGRSLYEGAKTGMTAASIPAATTMSLPALIRAGVGGTVGSTVGSKGAEVLGAGDFGQEVAGDVGGIVGGGLAERLPSAKRTLAAPVRLAARTTEAAANSKLRPGFKLFTPADEALKAKIKIPGRDLGLSKAAPTSEPVATPTQKLSEQIKAGSDVTPALKSKAPDYYATDEKAWQRYPQAGSAQDLDETRDIQAQVREQAGREQYGRIARANEEGYARNTRPRTPKGELIKRAQGGRLADKVRQAPGSSSEGDLTDILQKSLNQVKARQ